MTITKLQALLILSSTLSYGCEGFASSIALVNTLTATKTVATEKQFRGVNKQRPGLRLESTDITEATAHSSNFFSRVLRLSRRRSAPSARTQSDGSLSMQNAASIDESAQFDRIHQNVNNDDATNFILQQYETLTPDALFEPVDIATSANKKEVKSSSVGLAKSKRKLPIGRFARLHQIFRKQGATVGRGTKRSYTARGAIVATIAQKYMQRFLLQLIYRRTVTPPNNLKIRCFPRGNVLARLCRGYLGCDAKIDFGIMQFPSIRISSGSLEAQRIGLNLRAFRERRSSPKSKREEEGFRNVSNTKAPRLLPRYKHQFDLHANNLTFTSQDLFKSRCIRNGLQRLFFRLLTNRGIEASKVEITSIDILQNGKISCVGEATTVFGSIVAFEVRTSIGVSARGHVLTFPGLEISVGPSPLFPVLPTLDVDIGNNAKVHEIIIDGESKVLRLSATARITPLHTRKLSAKYSQSVNSYAASFSVDVGKWLTDIGNFST